VPFDYSADPLAAALLEEDANDLYENAPCGYFSVVDTGIIVKANTTFLTMTGYGREQLISRIRLLDILAAGSRILFETHLRPLLRMQGFLREVAVDLVCADGRHVPAFLNATERRAHGAETAVLRVMVLDATERRMYERELMVAQRKAEDAARARSDLIAMLSHDVRAPLGAVLTAAAILEKREPGSPHQRYIRVIQSSVTQAVTLLNSILDLSALDGGHGVLHERPFDVRSLVDEVETAASLAATKKHGLIVRTTVDAGVPAQLTGDRAKLAQVLTNLMSNAVKFTEQGVVSLVVRPREITARTVTLEWCVEDTGIGIPADRLPYIFDEFTQASEDIAQKYGGAGLGLAIARKLLLIHRTDLHVTSTVGQGTRFSFTLQLARVDGAGDAQTAP
jgi:PAS domain S-box-containing protein